MPSPRGMGSRDPCLQPETRNSLGTSGHVFGPPARGEPSSAFFESSKNLASSCRLKPIDTGNIAEKGERLGQSPQDHAIPNSTFCQELCDLDTLISYRRNFFSNLYDGKSEKPDLGTAFRDNPRLGRLPVLEGQFQD